MTKFNINVKIQDNDNNFSQLDNEIVLFYNLIEYFIHNVYSQIAYFISIYGLVFYIYIFDTFSLYTFTFPSRNFRISYEYALKVI